jgi:hypothetical protein
VDAQVAVSAVGGTATVVSYSPLIDVGRATYDITAEYTQQSSANGFDDQHIVAAFARAVGIATVGPQGDCSIFCSDILNGDTCTTDSIILDQGASQEFSYESGPLVYDNTRTVCTQSASSELSLCLDNKGVLVGQEVVGGIQFKSDFGYLRVIEGNVGLNRSQGSTFFVADQMVHVLGRPYECLTYWSNLKTFSIEPCTACKIGYDRPDNILGADTFESGVPLHISSPNSTTIKHTGGSLWVDKKNTSLCLLYGGLIRAACTPNPMQALFDVPQDSKSSLCAATEGVVEVTSTSGFGATLDCTTKSVLKGGNGYSAFDTLTETTGSPVTKKVVVQPLTGEEFGVVAPRTEIINITEYTGIFGKSVEQDIFAAPVKDGPVFLITNIILAVFNGLLLIMHTGLSVYGAALRKQFIFSGDY